MKKITLLTSLAIGLLASNLKAQDFPLTLHVKESVLTEVGDADDEDENGNFSQGIDTIKITDKDILDRIEFLTGIPIIKGDRIVIIEGLIEVWDEDDFVVADESNFDLFGILLAFEESDTSIEKIKGKDTEDIFKSSETFYLIITLIFDDGNGNAFTLAGLAKGSFSTSENFDKETFKTSLSWSLKGGSGGALVDGFDALGSGDTSAKGDEKGIIE